MRAAATEAGASTRRSFLEVDVQGEEGHRLLQMEPGVRFKNVLRALRRDGVLLWDGAPLPPSATPLSVGMPCGLANAVHLTLLPRGPAATAGEEAPQTRVFGENRAAAGGVGGRRARAPSAGGEGAGALEAGLRQLRLELAAERERREALEEELRRLGREGRQRRRRSAAEEIHQRQMEELRWQRGAARRARQPRAASPE
ncbi:uncharacterized protein Tco025E_02702 [Trypanosoma conorhini]|uniref:Uncharacterized protein n=1 Tax=Trypanosoma conorhini TaxID=83891 RepID=A0A422Q1B3_9TRYP|nr:uncharacterized protein Tco025E_02702 [Trypanosoma conorhini]RNF23801.1 hypothetical protein Tco025E_02702 [Trypanosoma conorhini]